MKKVFLILLVSITSNLIVAQAEFKAGINIANMSLGDSPYELSKALYRPEIGIRVNSDLSSDVNFAPEFNLSWKGMDYSYIRTVDNHLYDTSFNYTIETNYKVKLTYFEIPLMFIVPLEELNMTVEFGPSLGLRLGSKRVGETKVTTNYTSPGQPDFTATFSETGNYGNKDIFTKGIEAKRPVKSGEIGLNAGLRYELGNVIVGARYFYGITDVFNNDYPVKNTNIAKNANTVLKFYVGIPLD